MSKKNSNPSISRRRFVTATSAGSLALGLGITGFPAIVRSQGKTVKIGLIEPLTGPLAYSGNQCKEGALMAVEQINNDGGIRSLGGAKIELSIGDAQSKPEVGVAEVEKMNEAGVSAIVGSYASSLCLATTQAAAKYNIPHVVDVGVVDQVVTRGLTNTFRFGPGLSKIVDTGIGNLVTINKAARTPAKTVFIVHEESAFGSGLAKAMAEKLPPLGMQILDTISHPNPTRDFTNIALKIKAAKPDLIVPANYYNEFVLLARTLRQQKVQSKAIYAILGGAASSYKFVKEFPQDAQYIMDCNHWFDPKKPAALELKKQTEAKGLFFTYEVYLAYECVRLLGDALERSASTDRAAITYALAASSWANHIMPYGPTKFVNGQNEGAAPVNTQVQNGDIKVIFPADFANAKPIFPVPQHA